MRGRLKWPLRGLWLLAALELALISAGLWGISPLFPLILICALREEQGRLGLALTCGLVWDGLFSPSGCALTLGFAGAGLLAGGVHKLGLGSRWLEFLLAAGLGIFLCEGLRVIQGGGGLRGAALEGFITLLLAAPGYWLCPK